MRTSILLLILLLLLSPVLVLQFVGLHTDYNQCEHISSLLYVHNGEKYGCNRCHLHQEAFVTVFENLLSRLKTVVPQIETVQQFRFISQQELQNFSRERQCLNVDPVLDYTSQLVEGIVQYLTNLFLSNQAADSAGTMEETEQNTSLVEILNDTVSGADRKKEGNSMVVPRFEEVYRLLKDSKALMKNVTQMQSFVTPQLDAPINKPEPLESNLDILEIVNDSELNELQTFSGKTEFELWETTICKKLNPLFTNYNDELNAKLRAIIEEFESCTLMPYRESSRESFNGEFLKLQQLISSIDERPQEQQQRQASSTYLTRPNLLELYYKVSQHINSYSKDTLQKLHSFKRRTLKELSDFKRYKLELYKEWGNSIITEWSECMSIHDMTMNPTAFDLNTWRAFVQMKTQIVQAHVTLTQHELDLLPLQSYVKRNILQLNATIVSLNARLKECMEDARERFIRRDQEEDEIEMRLFEAIEREIEGYTQHLLDLK